VISCTSPNLHRIDIFGVWWIRQLKCGTAGFQDRDVATGRRVGGTFWQSKHIAIEVQRLVIVACGYN
jgi:hypothetical protein